jgi:hypothetical protein
MWDKVIANSVPCKSAQFQWHTACLRGGSSSKMFIMFIIFIWCDTCKTFQWTWELSSETCVAYLQTSLYAAGGYTGLGKNIHCCRFLSITVWFHGYSKNIPSFMILTYNQKYWGIYFSTSYQFQNLHLWTTQEVYVKFKLKKYFSIPSSSSTLENGRFMVPLVTIYQLYSLYSVWYEEYWH